MRFVCVWRRPAVSTITTSRPRAVAASSASYATAAGSPPRSEPTKSAPARCAQISSCSSAAARIRVGGGDEDGAAVLRELRRELADRRRLARAVDADDEDHGGRVREVERRRLTEQRGDLVGQVADPAARLEPLHELGRRADADIAGDECLLEPLPVGLVGGIERHHGRRDLARERPARLRERVTETGEEPSALLLRLGHGASLAQQFPPAPRHSSYSSQKPGSVCTPSPPSGRSLPMAMNSMPSGPASSERTVAGATRTASQGRSSTISSLSLIRPVPATTR